MAEGTAVAVVPKHILDRIAARGGAKSALLDAVVTGASFPRVSIRASRFRLVDDGVETVVGTEMDVVFVAVNPRVSKIFYDKKYTGDAEDKTPPACWSDDGITPDRQVAKPVNDVCATCPKNVLGSRITPSGAQSKECSDIRHTALVPSADPTKVYGLTVPVSGMKAFRKYFKELSQYGLNPEEVVTTLGFDDEASFPKITFAQKGYVPLKHLETIEAFGTAAETQAIIRVSAAPTGPALPRPAAAPSKPVEVEQPRLAVEKVVETPTDEDVPEQPTVVPARPAKRAAPAKDAADFHSNNTKAAPTKAAPTKAKGRVDDPVDQLDAQLNDLFGEG